MFARRDYILQRVLSETAIAHTFPSPKPRWCVMSIITTYWFIYWVLQHFIHSGYGVIYTYEDVELRRIFPHEFPQDTIRKSGSVDPEHLGRYNELKHYFKEPQSQLNSHFEELVCYKENGKKMCRVDVDRYAPAEDSFLMSTKNESHVDRRRVYCFMLLCFTEDELDRVTASF